MREEREADWKHLTSFTSLLQDLKSSPDWKEVEAKVVNQERRSWTEIGQSRNNIGRKQKL
jgi:hypothetical protein